MGALCSGVAGFIGMRVATAANNRTTEAARSSLNAALEGRYSPILNHCDKSSFSPFVDPDHGAVESDMEKYICKTGNQRPGPERRVL